MNYRNLGNTGLQVSEICLGAMTFGDPQHGSEIGKIGQQDADQLIQAALDTGINFFDTADVYSDGLSEIILGKALQSRRNDALIATKVRFAMSSRPNDSGLSRRHILESCEQSLRRLGRDHIDLYQVHSYDPLTPLGETLRALDDLVRSGKVRYIGCSNLTAWQTMKALAISEKLNLEQFVSCQLYYSLGARDIEHEIVPMCLDRKLGILCWSPLSGGFFTGKYRKGRPVPDDSRRAKREAASMKYWPVDEEKGYAIVDKLEEIALARGKSIPQAAINWLLCRPGVSSVIIGARKHSQLVDNSGASGWRLSDDEISALDGISAQRVMYPMWHQAGD